MNSENNLGHQDKVLIESAIQLCQHLIASPVCTEEQRFLLTKAIDLIGRLPLPLNYEGDIQIVAQLFPDGTNSLANLKRWWRVNVADKWLFISSWYDDPRLDQDEEDEFEFDWELRDGVPEIRSDTTPALWLNQINNFRELIEPGYKLTIEVIERFFKNKGE